MDFDAERRPSGGNMRVDIILNQLDDTEADQLRQALADPDSFPARVVARTVTKQTGHVLSPTAVGNWRERNL